jgi:exopolysaccharide production protein ExoQ
MSTPSKTGLAGSRTGLSTRLLSMDGSKDPSCAIALPRWHFAVAAFLIGLVFFLTEHNVNISLADAYTQSADEMELTAAGGNLLRRVALPGLAGLGLILLAVARQPLHLNRWLAGPLAAYLLVAAASCLWAVDPGLCLRRLIVLACAVLGAAGIARRFTMPELCQLTLAVVGPLVFIGLLSELRLGTFRPWSGDYRFAGSVHPNTQGAYCTAAALAALGLLGSGSAERKAALASFIAACLVLIVLTKSRTGSVASLLAIGSVVAMQTTMRWKLAAGFAAAWAGVAAIWLLMACGYDPLTDFREPLLLGRSDQADTLSGRAYIWPLVGHYIGLRPWLGYGYESFWNPAHVQLVSDELGWGVREAHNAYLDVLLSTGLAGLAWGIVAVAAGLVAAVRGSWRQRAYALPLGLLVFSLASSWMESGMVTVILPSWLAGCCLVRLALYEDAPTENDK